MYLPNYHTGSIVNFMSSVLQAFGGDSAYNPLEILPPSELKDINNVILFVMVRAARKSAPIIGSLSKKLPLLCSRFAGPTRCY